MTTNKILTATFIICLVIQIADSYAQNVAINNTGNQADQKHALEVIGSNTSNNTKAIYAENVPAAGSGGWWSYGIYGKVPSGFGYTIGVRGTSFNNVAQNEGRSYGGYFTAGNAGANSTGGWNYGMYAKLQGSLPGAAVVGFNDKDYDWDGNTKGSWAGYFVGDVKISGDLNIDGTANTGWHGSSTTIKILPSDFMPNDNSPYYNASIEDDATQKGVKNASTAIDLVAFVAIPEGYSTQGVTIYANGNVSTTVYEVDMTSGTWTNVGNGLTNTTTIANVSSTSTNYLAIKITSGGAINVIYGGTVTITN